MPVVKQLRAAGVSTEVYPDAAKLKKQFSYADAKHIPFVAIAGSEEMADGNLTLKDMTSGEQRRVTPDELIQAVR